MPPATRDTRLLEFSAPDMGGTPAGILFQAQIAMGGGRGRSRCFWMGGGGGRGCCRVSVAAGRQDVLKSATIPNYRAVAPAFAAGWPPLRARATALYFVAVSVFNRNLRS